MVNSESIQVLDTSVIHQLRSSLVITNLMQCLRELIHNAIDAKSTRIDISVDIEKFDLQVNDNGHGIHNMSKIGQRHVSSKCHTLSDISQLKTFGFRGEALAAITNEAAVHIISRHRSSNETFEGFWRDGRIIGCISGSKHTRKNHPGTSVIVRDLFYKFPVRRRYLASTAYQHVVMMESVKRLIINFALCFNKINFTLVDSTSNTKILITKKADTSLDIFRQLFGQELSKNVKYVNMHEDSIKVDGFFSTRGYPNKTHQYIYINNFLLPNVNKLYKTVSDVFASSKFATSFTEQQQQQEVPTKMKSKARSAVQKHPIFIIKFDCPKWSYYKVYMYLETLTAEPLPFNTILSLAEQITYKFLHLSNLVNTRSEKSAVVNQISKKRPRSSVVESASRNSPYLSHSSVTPSTFFDNTHSTVRQSPSVMFSNTEEEYPKYIVWWDESTKRTFYIDRITGNSYLSLPPTRATTAAIYQNSHTQNTVDRSHLKKTKLSSDNNLGNSCEEVENFHQQDDDRNSSNVFLDNDLVMDTTTRRLSKADLRNSKVLGQVDKKYIIIKQLKKEDNSANLIVLDQHAADERVKLEEMMQPQSMRSNTLDPSICLEFESQYEYQAITNDRALKSLKLWGIHITKISSFYSSNTVCNIDMNTANNAPSLPQSGSDVSPHFFQQHNTILTLEKSKQRSYSNKVYVTQLPNLIIDRCVINPTLLKDLIRDYAYWVKEEKNEAILRRTCPKGFMEILKSKACRNAVKFNDELTLRECEVIVKKLSKCNIPFQCAHGRPSAFPISIDLNLLHRSVRSINWGRH